MDESDGSKKRKQGIGTRGPLTGLGSTKMGDVSNMVAKKLCKGACSAT